MKPCRMHIGRNWLRRAACVVVAGVLVAPAAALATAVRGQAAPPSKDTTVSPQPVAEIVAQLVITGDVSKPLTLPVDDLRKMPRTTITVANEHQDKTNQGSVRRGSSIGVVEAGGRAAVERRGDGGLRTG